MRRRRALVDATSTWVRRVARAAEPETDQAIQLTIPELDSPQVSEVVVGAVATVAEAIQDLQDAGGRRRGPRRWWGSWSGCRRRWRARNLRGSGRLRAGSNEERERRYDGSRTER